MPLKTPVGFLIYNRPKVTQRVFDEIARAKPEMLLVVCDGPRTDRTGEREQVMATRAIIDQVDWPCEVLTNFSSENMGCKRRITSGLAWIFQVVQEAIILEDDCLPEPTFFTFCQDLLKYYRDDQRVVSISGNNFQDKQLQSRYSYYFSKYFHCWGWASWRRVWENFDPEMVTWPDFSEADSLSTFSDSHAEKIYWQRVFGLQYEGQINSWAYPWLYSCWAQSGLTAIPDVNLVSNIGFGTDATHTTGDSHLANLPTGPLTSMNHPPLCVRNKEADQHCFKRCYQRPPRLRRLQLKIQKRLPWKKPAA
ncbi:MAG: glycosyltransferase family 2 protein [Pirellulales bacterium]|nr:glycosyltransferase family 2 protein [Pirellulales bacterium]